MTSDRVTYGPETSMWKAIGVTRQPATTTATQLQMAAGVPHRPTRYPQIG